MRTEVEREPIPREFYDAIVCLKERLEEFQVPESDIDAALDRVERLILKALSCAEDDSEDLDEASDSDDDGEDLRPE